jgi:hypothetical protein
MPVYETTNRKNILPAWYSRRCSWLAGIRYAKFKKRRMSVYLNQWQVWYPLFGLTLQVSNRTKDGHERASVL